VNRTDRLYAIVEELRARAPRPMSRRWLADRFEVSPRTIERDIAGLQQAAVPIWSQRGREGGYGIDARHTLPPLNLTTLEATAVAVALAAAGSAPYAGHARTAAAKVAAVLTGGTGTGAATRIRVSPSPPVASPGVVVAVEEAVAQGRVAELSYRDREGHPTRRQVECHGLYARGRDWYVVGWCRLRDDRRLFRLDRIATISVLPEPVPERDVDEVLGWVPIPAERPSLLPDD
jgi:predicted DNA-binding transcriptional regulator YafY